MYCISKYIFMYINVKLFNDVDFFFLMHRVFYTVTLEHIE